MNVPISLRQTHPNMWFAVMIYGLWGILTGLNFLVADVAIELGLLQYVFGVCYLFLGTAKLSGLFNPKFMKLCRMGMLGCMILSSFLATIYIAGYVGGQLKGLQGAINFLALGVVQLAAMSEPAANPLTMKRKNNGSD